MIFFFFVQQQQPLKKRMTTNNQIMLSKNECCGCVYDFSIIITQGLRYLMAGVNRAFVFLQ